jgi:hypothetical protein
MLIDKAPFLLYISKPAVTNIEIGVQAGVWGLPHDAAENVPRT